MRKSLTRKELHDLLLAAPSHERDRKIKEHQNKFIEKSGISPRLFDCIFVRCTKRKHPLVERRVDMMDKKEDPKS